MRESELQSAVIATARWAGYAWYHTADSRRSPAGFPDLVLVHRRTGRIVFAELKSDTGRVTTQQRVWLDLIGRRGEAYVWRPDDYTSGRVAHALLTDPVAVAS